VTEFLEVILTDELQRAFRNWIERFKNVIAAEGALHPRKYPACHCLM
jgi:hypothetical protein